MAKNKVENNENVNEQEASKGKKMNPIIIIVILVVVLGVGAFGGAYLFMQKNSQKAKVIVETKVPILEDVTVNLADGKDRFLKTTVYISYNEKNSKLGDEITSKTVEVQDKAVLFLQSKSSDDFTSSNEEALKKELKNSINSILTKGEIVNVYFPNGFLVQ
ncbi:flagellar basal body-associated FliL family protein [Clostridium sp. MSJ-8]|uniref:flagellar basal body-associated FliL family protein n=1 Tax=Clostridium sp. MSJ-8 TaxID=2841510 RepID=UPI001C0F161D|nr:flagellar basal body-associated FliL family protein [Clostridium sp. MSJ-8]MBU5488390.1 flagellar basal body-associated FliL family protein [Clostridium sp. MSJ-8]